MNKMGTTQEYTINDLHLWLFNNGNEQIWFEFEEEKEDPYESNLNEIHLFMFNSGYEREWFEFEDDMKSIHSDVDDIGSEER